ncbi:aegerolysin family protein [Neptunomonas sp.]|uniref:aegerolysin family protein n=1 Tax=Neptunomonas sp. TaxID=1971898 RepID=UPI0035617F31
MSDNNELRTENQYCRVKLQNATGYDLELDSNELEWGKFTEGPIGLLANGTSQTLFVSKGRSGSPSGTKGDCAYRVGNTGVILKLSWDCPYGSPVSTPDAKFSHTTTPGDRFVVDGKSGTGKGVVKADLVITNK